MMIKCEHCKEDFNKKPSRIKLTKHHFCSAKCRNEGSKQTKKTGTIIQCRECNKDTYKNPSELKKSKNGNHFCGRACAQTYYGRNHKGTNHPNWIDGSAIYRKRAIDAYGEKCNRCGFNEYISILQVHHKNHNRKDNGLENLEVLCPNCHQIEHIDKHGGAMYKPVP